MIGETIGHYRLLEKLGEGGMGVVYKAQDNLLNRPVAVKTLNPALLGPEGVARLLREAQATAQLTHPNIVAVYDVIEDGDTRLIVMEHVEGVTLRDLIPLGIPRAVDLAVQVCYALKYAHSRGIIHRDIKPENLMVTASGTVKVLDFGLARSEGRTRLTQSGLIVGTVAYMAPEQVLGGTVDGRSDLYSLGCVLYEALTGRKPFEGDDAFAVLSQHVNVMPVAPRWHHPAILPTLDAIMMRLLAKNPLDRYASAGDVIEALRIVSQPDAQDTTIAIPHGATRATLLEHIVRGKLVGRVAELAELREHLDRVLSGDGRLVLVSGEPGIGKTRLANELAIYAHLRGAWVLRGHCDEQDVGVPYLPFVESLRQLFSLAGRGSVEKLGERMIDLALFLPEIGSKDAPARALSPEDERIRIFDSVSQWAATASRQRPMVFVLDDLHWADRTSLRLLHHLARTLRHDRILLLGTYREMELDADHPLEALLNQMNRERLLYRVALRRFSEADTQMLLSGIFDTQISKDLTSAIYRETEGNPFFIEEVVKGLVEEGKIYQADGRWQQLRIEELEIPRSVKAAIGRRLQKAGETSRRVLTIAAVIGREFDPDVLVTTSQLPEDSVLDALDEAKRLQVIRETRGLRGTRYTFEHALIRQTLYEDLNARRRARLHQQVGEALEVTYRARPEDHLEELAYHFGESGLAVADKGIEYNLRAARKAADLFALEEAERRLKVALELADAREDPQVRVKVLQAMGDLYRAFAERRRAAEVYERALQILMQQGDAASDQTIDLLLKLADASTTFATDIAPKARGHALRAVELLQARGDSPVKARALALLALHQLRAGEIPTARATASEAIALATRVKDRDALITAYQAMASVHRSSNEWDGFRQFVEKRKALLGGVLTATDVDMFVDLVQSYTVGGNNRNYNEAERVTREFLQTATKLRSPTAMFHAHHWLHVLAQRGDWDAALQHAEHAIDLGRRIPGVTILLGWVLASSALLHGARGQDVQARDLITEVEALSYDVPPEHTGPRQNVIHRARMLGDRDLVSRLLARVEVEQPRCLTCQLLWHVAVGNTHFWLGDIDMAERHLHDAERVLPDNPDPWGLSGPAMLRARILRVRGDADAAIDAVERGLQHLAKEEIDFYGAEYRYRAAEIYLHRRNPSDVALARGLLSEALTYFQAVGAKRFIKEAQDLLETTTAE